MGREKKLTEAGRKIVGALTEFCDTLERGEAVADRFTVRRVRLTLEPRPFGPDEVKRLRDSFRLSQPLFAGLLGVTVKTVRSWEQGRKPPSPMACRFMDEMRTAPDYWKGRLQQILCVRDDRTARA